MIAHLIHWSIANRFMVLLAAIALAVIGTLSLLRTPLDALPDLTPIEVIVHTSWPGQAPQVVEDQVTYPLTTAMMSVPGSTTVRGFSSFGNSFVYVLFEDGTDLYWARSRVLTYLARARAQLPPDVQPEMGPDATGVGWVYEYALIDRTGKHDLGQLTALQDWFLRYRLLSVPNVAEVATLGGMQNAWQIVLDPGELASRGITVAQVINAIKQANGATGGSVIEQGEAEMMVNVTGYLQSREDFARIPIGTSKDSTPVLLRDVARIRRGPTERRGVAELDGQGQVVGGVVIMRYHKNALATIAAVKAKLAELQKSLPAGVEIVPTYDRSKLIQSSVSNINQKLIEEFIVVALVCLLFLWHLRSSLIAVISLPLGVLTAFIVMDLQGLSSDVMSLAGIAIAIGEMVDAAVVMIENTHRHLETWQREHPDRSRPTPKEHWELVAAAVTEVGPALFFSLLVITLSFLPVFALQAQEGKMFKPLAFTKTYSVAAAAGLSVTLVPVLMGYLVRGKIRPEYANPLNRWLRAAYQPLLAWALRMPRMVLVVAVIVLASALFPLSQLGSQFMPAFDEGTLLYMPTALPGLSAGKAAQLLQQTDRMLKTVPEVAHVFGQAGRAESATDSAPLSMFDTTITFKPQSEWRAGMTMDKLKAELDRAVQVPGLTNLFIYPILNREQMVTTGIKTPIGIKVMGPNLRELQRLAIEIQNVVKGMPGVTSAVAERSFGGRYVQVQIHRDVAARYGLSQQDLQSLIAKAVGGETIGKTIQGLERFPIVVRYPRAVRDTLASLRTLPIVAPNGAQVTLGQVADLTITDGPPMITSEDGVPATYVYVDSASGDLGGLVATLQRAVARQVQLPAGYTVEWAGQFQQLQHAEQRLKLVVPATVILVFVLIWLIFRDTTQTLIIFVTVPLGLVGGFWLTWLLGYEVSVATVVGFIGLAGITSEFGVVMMLYLRTAWQSQCEAGNANEEGLAAAIREGALLRVRPIAMTVAVIFLGLLPIMFGSGSGSNLVRSIATPMVGGMITAPILSMLVIPVAFRLLERRRLQKRNEQHFLQQEENRS